MGGSGTAARRAAPYLLAAVAVALGAALLFLASPTGWPLERHEAGSEDPPGAAGPWLDVPTAYNGSNLSAPDFRIHVVYFAYLPPDRDWETLVRMQLADLCRTRLPARATTITVTLATPLNGTYPEAEARLHRGVEVASHLLRRCGGDPRFDATIGNLFEFPGLAVIWRAALRVPPAVAPTTLFLYFHSKGMVHHGAQLKREVYGFMFDTVVAQWPRALAAFASDPLLDKAGHSAAPQGWMWYNYFWVRASYVKSESAPPVRTEYRHYYEEWLGRVREAPLWHAGRAADVTLHADLLGGHPLDGRKASCSNSWSMCLRNYTRGISFLPHTTWKCKDIFVKNLTITPVGGDAKGPCVVVE